MSNDSPTQTRLARAATDKRVCRLVAHAKECKHTTVLFLSLPADACALAVNHIIGAASAVGLDAAHAQGQRPGEAPPRRDDEPVERPSPLTEGSDVGHPPVSEAILPIFADPPVDLLSNDDNSDAEYHELPKDLPSASSQPEHPPSFEGMASTSSSYEVQAELDAVF